MAKRKPSAGSLAEAPASPPTSSAGNPPETLKSRLLRQPWVAALIAISALVTGLASFTSALDSVLNFVEKHLGRQVARAMVPAKILSQSPEDCVRSDRNCRVDLWLQNPSDKPLYVTGLALRVLDVGNDPTLGTLEPSASYRVDLTGLSSAGMTRKVPLYQVIEAQKSDRFALLLGARDLKGRFRHWRLEAKLETSAGELPIRPLTIKLPWDSEYSGGPPVAVPTPAGSAAEVPR